MKIAICQNTNMWNHPHSNVAPLFSKICATHGVEYDIVDPYRSDIINVLKEYDGIIWIFQNFLLADHLEAKNILKSASIMGLKVYPNPNTNWTFDDKIAEMYALQSINAPIPDSHVFYSKETALEFFKTCRFPIVAKLRCGSGSNNVKLLKDFNSAKAYTSKMFGRGFSPAPSLIFKAKSKAGSAHDWKTIISRLKKLPTFLYTRRHAKMMPREKGYVYLQEFIPDNEFDYRVHVCDGKSWACMRRVRKGDFRASGSSDLIYDSQSVPLEMIRIAFKTAEALKMQCVAFDFIHDKRDGSYRILEMSYSFGFDKEDGENGYWDRNLNFHTEFFSPYDWMVNTITNTTQS